MRCPHCENEHLPSNARYCPECGKAVEISSRVVIHQDVGKNLGNVIGVQTETIEGNVYGGDIYEVQVYVLEDSDEEKVWHHFIDENTPPYKYFSPYTTQDQPLFVGRDREIDQIIRQIGEYRTLLIYGSAGVGKSSLLSAGVIPELIDFGALVLHIRDYLDPIQSIFDALKAASAQLSLPIQERSSLPKLLKTVQEKTQGTLVLVFDQFEQVLSPNFPESMRKNLFEEIVASREAILAEYLRMVFCIQEHALGNFRQFQAPFPELERQPYQVHPLALAQAKHAIEAPLETLDYPVSFVGDLVDKLLIPDLDGLSPNNPGRIDPIHLQIVCYHLYELARERRPPHIDVDLYLNTANSADGILARYLEDTLRTKFPKARALAEKILIHMTKPGVDGWITPSELPENGHALEDLRIVLDRLAEANLLIRHGKNSGQKYRFTNPFIQGEIRRLAGRDVERQYQVEEELDWIWAAWLARDALATSGQLRYLRQYGSHLQPQPPQILLLLRSTVAQNEDPRPWLAMLRDGKGETFIKQLEGETVEEPASLSSVSKGHSLLGLALEVPATAPSKGERPFGPIAEAAVTHSQPIIRQTAALSLTAYPAHETIDRIDWALQEILQGREKLWRKGELFGTLAESAPEVNKLIQGLPPIDRLIIWTWRVRRRLIRERNLIGGMVLGGGIGAGLGLGLLRALMAIPARQTIGVQFSINFFWAVILGAFLSLGIAIAGPIRAKPPNNDRGVTIQHFFRDPNRSPAVLSTLLGTVFFGLAHLLVAVMNGLVLSEKPLMIPAGFLAGLGLSIGILDQPRSGWSQKPTRWLTRLLAAAIGFLTAQIIVLAYGYTWAATSITKSSKFFIDRFSRYPQLERLFAISPETPNLMALVDASIVGIVLTIGTTAGILIAAKWLKRWQDLIHQARDF